MNQVLFEDLVASKEILSGLAKLEAANQKFADHAVAQNERIKQSLIGLEGEFTNYRSLIASVNNNQKGASTQLSGLKDDVAGLTQSYRGYNDQIKRNEAFVQSNAQVIDQMRLRMAQLSAEYSKLDLSQKNDIRRKKEIEKELTQTTRAYDALIRVTNAATKATAAAEGSYRALDLATQKLRADLKAMPNAFDLTTGAINKHNRAAVEMQKQIEKNDRVLKQVDAGMGQYQRNVGNYGKAFQDIGGQLLGFTGVAGAVMAAIAAIKTGLSIIQDGERLTMGLKAASRDTADFARSQQFLMGLADRLGVEYDTLIDSYKGLKAATKDTVLEGRNTEKMFSAVATAGAKLGLTNDTVQGTLLALTQMISKGHIQAEELRGQLGERLPGALKLMAEALGVSETKLNKMMEQGQLIATEVMPQFADQLGKTFGLKTNEQIETTAANFNRLKNEGEQLVRAFNDSGSVTSFFNAISKGLSTSLGDIRRWLKDGSVLELVTFFGNNSLTAKNQLRRDKEDAVTNFGNLDAAGRKKELDRLRKLEAEQIKAGSDERWKTREIRRKLQDEDLKAQVSGMQDGRRKLALAEKDAIDKNETDIARFQKQALRKRTAEIIALEKTIAADAKKGFDNTTAKSKLELYTRLDAEQRAKDKQVSDRIKSQKPVKANDDTELEKIDKQIKSIEKTLQTQAMADLKAGRVVDVDASLVAKVQKLKEQYEAIKDLQKAIEDGVYNNKPVYSAETLTGKGVREVGKTGKNGKELNGEQLKADAAKTLATQTETLAKQTAILEEYGIKREAIEGRVGRRMTHLRREQQTELLDLLAMQEDAERAGNQKEVENLQRLIDQKKMLYEQDFQNRKAVIEKAIEIGSALVNGLFDIETAKAQQRQIDLDKQKDIDLARAGDNANAKAAIEKKYDEESKRLKHEQDVRDRNQAMFNIAVSTAVAVAQALPNVPLSIAIGILGAVQAGLVLARPLPQYKNGKNVDGGDRYEGPALAGEAGRELWVQDGKATLLDKPTVIDVGRDDVIYPNHITERLLRGDYAENGDIMRRTRHQQQSTDSLNRSRDQYQARLYMQSMRSPSAGAIGKAVAAEFAQLPLNYATFDERGVTTYTQTASGNRVTQRNKHQLGGR